MRYGAFLQIFREIREGMEGKGGKWEFSAQARFKLRIKNDE